MNEITQDYIIDYIRNTVCDNDDFLKSLEAYAKEHHVPIIQKEAGRFLSVLTSLIRPKNILEVGTAIGYSALLFYNATDKKAHITTIEKNEKMVQLATGNIKQYGAEEKIEVVFGDALEEIDKLEKSYDLIFIDAAKGQYMGFLESGLKKLNPGGVIITDNVLYGGTVATNEWPEKKHRTIILRLREYLTILCNDKRFDTAIIPVGDGMAITRVKE